MKFRKPIKWKNKSKPVVYRKSRRFDKSCRNHGGCPWCERNRTYSNKKARFAVEQDLDDFLRL